MGGHYSLSVCVTTAGRSAIRPCREEREHSPGPRSLPYGVFVHTYNNTCISGVAQIHVVSIANL